MLQSVRVSKRQSELREKLAGLSAVETPTDEQLNEMRSLDREYSANETKFRAALVAESEERKASEKDFETRSDKEYSALVDRFELRQVVLALSEGQALSGETSEVVAEMRSQGGYRGVPVPLMALERRSGETIAAATPDPIRTMPIIARLFPASVVARLGGQLVDVGTGLLEYPVTTSGVQVGWAATELGNVGSPHEFETEDRVLRPNHNMGAQMIISRRALKQSGQALEQAIRRDLSAAISAELDRIAFQGQGASGEPAGILVGDYDIVTTDINAAVAYSHFRTAAVAFMTANAATSFKDVAIAFRPEVINVLDAAFLEVGSGITMFDVISNRFGTVVATNSLPAPAGSPLETSAVLATSAGNQSPFWLATWGGIDVLADPYSFSGSGALKLSGLLTCDCTVSRPEQLQILTGLR